jgi:hypothetical protein
MSDNALLAVSKPRRVPLLAAAIALFAAVAAVFWPTTYIGMVGAYAGQIVVLPVALLLGLPLAALILNPRSPGPFLIGLVRESGLRLALTALAVCLGLAAFTTFKLAIPKLVPFYADPLFADLDAALFFGSNPGEVAHALIPSWLQYPIGLLYGPIWFLHWFGFIAFVAALRDAELRRRYFWTMAIAVCGLGVIAATAFSSVGPILYEQIYGVDRFPELMATLRSSAVGEYMQIASGYLYDAYLHGNAPAGSGISAMPSMHLAIATLNAWMLTRLHPVAGAVGWTYTAIILVGSVFMGWHYLIDGYASILAVSLVWWLLGRPLFKAPPRFPAPYPASSATPPTGR